MIARRALAGALALPLLPPLARAQPQYPVNPVTLVTHSSPGGGSDVFLRELTKHLTPVMNTSALPNRAESTPPAPNSNQKMGALEGVMRFMIATMQFRGASLRPGPR